MAVPAGLPSAAIAVPPVDGGSPVVCVDSSAAYRSWRRGYLPVAVESRAVRSMKNGMCGRRRARPRSMMGKEGIYVFSPLFLGAKRLNGSVCGRAPRERSAAAPPPARACFALPGVMDSGQSGGGGAPGSHRGTGWGAGGALGTPDDSSAFARLLAAASRSFRAIRARRAAMSSFASCASLRAKGRR